ncbi:hypothetical protein FRC10_002320 [Ceratobasidium sp. 414]|nr:hypothetical protein FRC10_002320 [Ceratobasidium sp. 414]
MSQVNEEQMHGACERLDGIPDFDGSEKKETKAVWRRKFENRVDPYGPSGVQKAALWKGKVDADSIAQDWLDTMPQLDIDTWTKLAAELFKRWPGQSMVEKAKVKIDNWYAHAFDEVKVVEMVEGTGGKMEAYYMHMMLATTLGGDEPSKLHYTWSRVIPPALKEALRKGLNDYTTVSGLCSDIIGLEMDRVKLWAAFSRSKPDETKEELAQSVATGLEELLRRMDNLAIMSQTPPRAPHPNVCFAPTPAPNAPQLQQVYPPSCPATMNRPAPSQPLLAPQTPDPVDDQDHDPIFNTLHILPTDPNL